MKQAGGWRSWGRAGALVMAVGCSEPQFARVDEDGSMPDPAMEPETSDHDPMVVPDPPDAEVGSRDTHVDAGAEAGVSAPRGPSAQLDAGFAGARDAAVLGPDARTPPAAAREDAGSPAVQPGNPLPAWTSQLAGDYAIEGYTFSEDLRVVIRWRVLWLAHIARVGDGYEAQLTLCDVSAASAGGTSSGASKLSDAPPRRHTIDITGDRMFDVRPIEVAQGYEERTPDICEGKLGMMVAKQPFQTWIEGPQCRCSVEALPRSADDCRVTDPDEDGRAGITGVASALGSKFTMWGVSAVRSGLVQGRIGAERKHTALYQVNESFQRFGCEGGAICNLQSAAVDCTTEHHPVRFAPIDAIARPPAGWSCATMMERVDTLFPGPPPPSPATCVRR